MKRYRDCYIQYKGDVLLLGNGLLERALSLKDSRPEAHYLLNKRSKQRWHGKNGHRMLLWNIPGVDFQNGVFHVDIRKDNNNSLSREHLLAEILFQAREIQLKAQLRIFPGIPFINTTMYIRGQVASTVAITPSTGEENATGVEDDERERNDTENSPQFHSPESDSIEAFAIDRKHLKLEVIQLKDVTDQNDFLVHKHKLPVNVRGRHAFGGDMFIIEDYLDNEGLMMVKEAPTSTAALNRTQDELQIEAGRSVQLRGTGFDYASLNTDQWMPAYGSTIGVGETDRMKRAYKAFYNSVYKGEPSRNLFIMSNTWGDRNRDAVVCEEFIRKEIDAGSRIGIDIVQIDDGWQKGATSNSALKKDGVWEGYYDFDPDFWETDTDKFPSGLGSVVNYAGRRGLRIGLWFSPDSSNDFANWEKDASVLMGLYKQYDIRHFKFDAIKIRNKRCETNLIHLLEKVSLESENRITFNMDITAEVRFGYLYEKQYGTIFVENRYTDWGNYHPHNTFKNLWQLTELFPAKKFQFEILNHKRNEDNYIGDPLAPAQYSIDYLFASVMVSNPLLWMEMSNLGKGDRDLLKEIIDVYKKERQNLFSGEVLPIGDMPDGIRFCGYQVKTDNRSGYFLLFRERTEEDGYTFASHDLWNGNFDCEILYSNVKNKDEIVLSPGKQGELKTVLPEQRSFVFVKYRQSESGG